MQLFHFSKITLNKINGIKCLDGSKAAQSNQIPTKVIKENYDIFAPFITENFNNMIENSVFPVSLKQADIKPIHKKYSRSEKENYKPVSILPNLSKIYGRGLYTQVNKYFDLILCKYQLRFRKRCSAQQMSTYFDRKMKSVFRSKKSNSSLTYFLRYCLKTLQTCFFGNFGNA